MPQEPQAHLMLGITLAESSFPDGAIVELGKALKLGLTDAAAEATAHELLGVLHATEGRNEEALAHHEAALERAPEMALAHANRGAVLIALARYDEAAAPLERALELDPELAYPHLCLGLLYMEFLGDPNRARTHLRAYNKLGGQDPRPAEWLRGRVR